MKDKTNDSVNSGSGPAANSSSLSTSTSTSSSPSGDQKSSESSPNGGHGTDTVSGETDEMGNETTQPEDENTLDAASDIADADVAAEGSGNSTAKLGNLRGSIMQPLEPAQERPASPLVNDQIVRDLGFYDIWIDKDNKVTVRTK